MLLVENNELRKFVSGPKTVLQDVQTVLNDREWVTAERLAHTLKSVVDNISRGSVQQAAGEQVLQPAKAAWQAKLPREAKATLTWADNRKISHICARR